MRRGCVALGASLPVRQAPQKKQTRASTGSAGSQSSPSASTTSDERYRLPDRIKASSADVDRPVYLKPSSSAHRRPSFYIPRMRDPDDLIKMDRRLVCAGDGLGSAMPLFSIASSSCDYYALRLPLLKAGFKRVLAPPSGMATNLIWAKSMPFRRFKVSRRQPDGDASGEPDASTYSLRFAEPTTPEQAQHIDSLTMVHDRQRFNHFPLSHRNMGSKKGMANNIARTVDAIARTGAPHAAADGAAMYSFVPRTWFYPAQKAELEQVFRASPTSAHFIWKPSLGSCGRGICFSKGGARHAKSWERVMRRIDEKAADEESGKLFRQYVVQDYVENPLLLDGRKMDLRLYVAVTSYDPLVLYVHDEGLVRLAAAVYDGDDGADTVASAVPGAHMDVDADDDDDGANSTQGRFKHLTNYSIGRKYAPNKPRDGVPSPLSCGPEDLAMPELKWSFEKLWSYLDSQSGSPAFANVPAATTPSAWVREQIALLVVRTFMAGKANMSTALTEVSTSGGYFELYGVDVMLDAQLAPWLIEINTLPSLESSSAFDYATKTNVVSDLLNLAMMEPFARPRDTLQGSHHGQTGQFVSAAMSPQVEKLLAPASGFVRPVRLSPRERHAEMKSAMDDAFQYARGFKRIFPPVPCQDELSQYPLKVDNRALRADTELFASMGTLTENDHALLRTL